MTKEPLTLAIDTSFDETSVSIVQGLRVLSNVLPSQMEFHAKFGGVVPSLAKLAHIDRIDNVVVESLKRAKKDINDIDYIAVTVGPGLAITLEVGIKKAKELAEKYNKPLVTVNHMVGHLYSGFASSGESEIRNSKFDFPVLGVLVSGGHTELILVRSIGDYKKIGETKDDACGECYDKCGRMLGLGYPAGPVISKFASEHRKNVELKIFNDNKSVLVRGTNKKTGKEYVLPVPMVNSGDLDFSYSGLKTAFKRLIGETKLSKPEILDICVVFEAAALMQIIFKLECAIKIYKPKEVWLGGGVVASVRLRSLVRSLCKKYEITVRYPTKKKLTADNAAMIGVAANIHLKQITNYEFRISNEKRFIGDLKSVAMFVGNFDKIDRKPNLSL